MNKKNKYILFWSIIWFTILFTIWFIFFFHHWKKKINKPITKVVHTVNNICTINLPYIYPDKVKLLMDSLSPYHIKFQKKNNLSSNTVVDCTLKKKDKQVIQILNKPWYLLKNYFTYWVSINNKTNDYQINIRNIDFQRIRNSFISVIKINNDMKSSYNYFSDDPNITLFMRTLKKVNNNLTLGLTLDINKITGFKKLRYNEILSKFWNNIIITNTKIIIKLLPDDFSILQTKLKQLKLEDKADTIKKLQILSKVYENTIVYKWKYLIIQNTKQLIDALKK